MGLARIAVVGLLSSIATALLLSFVADGWVRNYVGAVNFSLDQIPDLTGKTAIVTGPTLGGIGYVTALELARKGAKVIVGARSLSKGLEALSAIKKELGGKGDVHFKELDLADLSSVKKFADEFIKSGSPLHILMNNAGVMACPFGLTKQGIELQFGTNHLGHFLLTSKLLPVLKKSQPSRVVTTSSAAHYMLEWFGSLNMSDIYAASNATYSPWAAYGRSKLANVLFTVELDKKLEGTQVYANALHPGGVRTNLQTHVAADLRARAGEMLQKMLQQVTNPLLMSPQQGAVTQLFLATSPRIELEEVRGRYFHPQARETAPSKLVTPENARSLWELSERLVADYVK